MYCLFLHFLARQVVYFLSLPANTLRQLFAELLWMFDEKAILEESLAVMTVDTEASRNARGPWGLLKLQQHSKKTNSKAIHIVLDRLLVAGGLELLRGVDCWVFPASQ